MAQSYNSKSLKLEKARMPGGKVLGLPHTKHTKVPSKQWTVLTVLSYSTSISGFNSEKLDLFYPSSINLPFFRSVSSVRYALTISSTSAIISTLILEQNFTINLTTPFSLTSLVIHLLSPHFQISLYVSLHSTPCPHLPLLSSSSLIPILFTATVFGLAIISVIFD